MGFFGDLRNINSNQSSSSPNNSWYSGEQPTRKDVLARITSIYQQDPARGMKLYNDYNYLRSDPSSKYYYAYSQPTNQAVSNLAALGFDTNNLNSEWVSNNSTWIQSNLIYNGTTNTPTKPGKKSTAQQQAAYWLYQWDKSEAQTQQAEKEYQDMIEEAKFWTKYEGRNYSDQEAYDKVMTDFAKKYPTLARMQDNSFAPLELNRAVDFSDDSIWGAIWQARNPEYQGNMEGAMANSALGVGNQWQENPDIADKLNPESDKFNPYAIGSTNLDDAARYFGTYIFDKGWLQKHNGIQWSGDEDQKKYYGYVQKAEANTLAAEEAVSALDQWLNDLHESNPEKAKQKLDKALAKGEITIGRGKDRKTVDISILNKMDESIGKDGKPGTGNLLAMTRGVDYKYSDFLQKLQTKCGDNSEDDTPVAAASSALGNLGIAIATAFSAANEAVMKAQNQKLAEDIETVDDVLTPEEQNNFNKSPVLVTPVQIPQNLPAQNPTGMQGPVNQKMISPVEQQTPATAQEQQAAPAAKDTTGTVNIPQQAKSAIMRDPVQIADAFVKQEADRNATVFWETEKEISCWQKNSEKIDKLLADQREIEAQLGDKFAYMDANGELDEATVTVNVGGMDLHLVMQRNIDGTFSATNIFDDSAINLLQLGDEFYNYYDREAVEQEIQSVSELLQQRNALSAEKMEKDIEITDEDRDLYTRWKADQSYLTEARQYEVDHQDEYEAQRKRRQESERSKELTKNLLIKAGISPDRFAADEYVNDIMSVYSDKSVNTVEVDNWLDDYMDQLTVLGTISPEDQEEIAAGITMIDNILDAQSAAMEYAQKNGIPIPQDYIDNMNTHREQLEHNKTAYEYFKLMENEDFQEVATRTQNDVELVRETDPTGRSAAQLGAFPAEISSDFVRRSELQVYYYILATQGKDAARAYYDYLAPTLSARTYENAELLGHELTSSGPLGMIGANVLAATGSVAETILGGLWFLGSLLSGDRQGNHAFLGGHAFSQAVYGDTSNAIEDAIRSAGGGDFAVEVGKGMYSNVYNRARSAAQGVVFGGLGSQNEIISAIPMAIGAATGAAGDALTMGAGDKETALIFLTTLAAESVTEGIRMKHMSDALDAVRMPGGLAKELLNFLPEGVSEMIGESLNDIVEEKMDEALMGEESHHAKAVEEYMMKGYMPDEAEDAARRDELLNVVRTGVTAFFGPLLDLGGYAAQRIADGSYYRSRSKELYNSLGVTISPKILRQLDQQKAEMEAAQITDPAEKEYLYDQRMLSLAESNYAAKRAVGLTSVLTVDSQAESADMAAAAYNHLDILFDENADVVSEVRSLLDAARIGGIPANQVKLGLQLAALSRGSKARAAMISEDFQQASPFQKAQMLAEASTADISDKSVQKDVLAAVRENRLYEMEKQIIAEGALDEASKAQEKADDAAIETAKAQSELEVRENAVDAATQEQTAAAEEVVNDPTDDNLKRLTQAQSEVQAKDESRHQYEQHLDNQVQEQQKAEAEAKKAKEDGMNTVRQEAEQRLAQEDARRAQEKEQQRIAEEVREKAEQTQRETNNVSRMDADAFIEQNFPNATEEEKQKIRREFIKQRHEMGMTSDALLERGKFARGLQQKFGYNITIKDTSEGGTKVRQNAYVDKSTGDIVMDINATMDDMMYAVLGHEVTHIAEKSGTYQELADALLKLRYGDETSYQGILDAIKSGDKSSKAYSDIMGKKGLYDSQLNKTHTEEEMLQEIVADEMGKLLSSDQELINQFVAGKQSLAKRMIESIKRFIKKMAGIEGAPIENARNIVTMLENALKDANVGNVSQAETKNSLIEGEAQPSVEDPNGTVLTGELPGGTEVKYSLNSWTEDEQKRVRDALIEKGFSEEETDNWIANTNGLAAMIAKERTRLDFDVTDPEKSMFKPNADYGATIDASTLCAKRLLYQGTFDAIQHQLPNTPLMPDDLIRLANMMREMGYETPCGICYVESRRRNLDKFADEWLKSYNGEYVPKLDEVTTSDGLETLRKDHRETYDDFIQAMKDLNQRNPKVVQLRTEYRGEIGRMTDNAVQKAINHGGLRLQSFSDFETPHLLDMVQVVMDMSSKGLTSQAYTKVPNFAWAFGDTGIKINLSLIGKGEGVDENGNLLFDDVEGMPYEEAIKLRNRYSKNVGTILVGINDKQILAAMADPNIDYIIPFHRSGWTKNDLRLMPVIEKYKDYTLTQNERDAKTGKKTDKNLEPVGQKTKRGDGYWDFNLSGKENAEKYLDLCFKNKIIPKFDQFLDKDAKGHYHLKEDGSTDGYWKTLIDFKMYDNEGNGSPQTAVTPNINMAEAQRIMNEYKLERPQPGKDVDPVKMKDNNSLPVADPVVDRYVEEYKANHPDRKYSLPEDSSYMDAVENGDMEEAQKIVDKAAEEAGYIKAGYHGTLNGGFTIFDKSKAGIGGNSGAGFYFSSNLADSESNYADNEGADNWFKANHLADKILEEFRESDEEDFEYEGHKITEGMSYDEVVEIAKDILTQNPETYHVYLDPGKAYIRNFNSSTNLIGDVIDNFDESLYDPNDYDNEDDYYDELSMARSEEIYQAISDAVYNGIADVDSNYEVLANVNYEDIIGKLAEIAMDYDELTWNDLIKVLEDQYIDLATPDMTGSADGSHEIARAIVEAFGFDSIEDREVSKKFNQLKNMGRAGDTVHYIMFRPNQIKLADTVTYDNDGNVIPPSKRFNEQNNDIRYSLPEDAPYLSAVNHGDMEAADEDLKQVAASKGFDTSEYAYHGTVSFGFTEFDMDRSQNEIFVAYNPLISKSYTQNGSIMDINESNDRKIVYDPNEKDLTKLARQVEEKGFLKDHIFGSNGRYLVDQVNLFDSEDMQHMLKEYREDIFNSFPEGALNSDIKTYEGAGVRNRIMNVLSLFNPYFGYTNVKNSTYGEFLNQALDTIEQNSERIVQKFGKEELDHLAANLISMYDSLTYLRGFGLRMPAITGFVTGQRFKDGGKQVYQVHYKLDHTPRETFVTGEELADWANNTSTKQNGIYKFYTRPGKQLVVEADGANWNTISWYSVEEADPDASGYYLDNHSTTTREISAWAKEHGYDSVRINKVNDYGGKSGGYDSAFGDIGIFFNQEDVKSADTVTYDDDGNIIPPSERFNDEQKDFRYSLPSDDVLGQQIQQYLRNGGNLANQNLPAEQTNLPGNPVAEEGGNAQRQFGRQTAQTSNALHDEVKDYLYHNSSYTQDSNQAQIDRAISWVQSLASGNDSDGYNAAVREVTSDGFDYRSADGQARMLTVMSMAALKGDLNSELQIADAFNKQGTDLGRQLQARKIFRLMTPLGRINVLENMVNQVNDDLGRRGLNTRINLSEWTLKAASEAKTEEEFDRVRKEAAKEIAEQVPANWKDKLRGWRMLSMLGNPRTHIRNVVGNALFVPVVSLKNKLGAVAELGLEKGQRTKTLAPVLSKEIRSFAKEDAKTMKDVLTGEAKYNETNAVQKEQKAFKGLLQALMDFNSNALEKEDWTFLKGHYKRALGGWMKANGYTAEQLQQNPSLLEQGRAYAVQEAQKATYRDFSKIASILNDVSRKGGVAGFITDAVLPFKKTPANILKRGIEYSPAGIMRSLTTDLYHLKQYKDYQDGKLKALPDKAISPTQFIDRLCSGLAGSAILAVGALLGHSGIVSTGLGDDDDKFEKEQGNQPYAIKIGGHTFTLDWAAPMSMPFFVGAAIAEQLSNQKGFDIEKLVDAFGNITEPVFNLSMLDGVNSLLKISSNGNESNTTLTQIAAKVASNYATSYVPSIVGAAARTIDDTRRKAYVESGKGNGIMGTFRYAKEQTENKIPGLSQTNIPVRDVFGNPETSGLAERILENFILPGYVTEYKNDPVLNEMSRLYDANVTDSNSMIPKDPGKTVTYKNQKYVLSAEEWDTYKEVRGKTAYQTLTDLMNDTDYQKADDATQVQMFKKAWEYADQVGKAVIIPGYEVEKTGADPASTVVKEGKITGYKSNMMKALADGDIEGYEAMVEGLREEGVEDSEIKNKISGKYRDMYKDAYKRKDYAEMAEIEELLDMTGFDFDYGKWEEQVDEKYGY